MNPKIKRRIAIAFFVAVALLLYLIRGVLLPFVFSGIFIYLLAPAVDFLAGQSLFGRKAPRGLAVMLVFIFFFLGLGILALLILPPLYEEVLRIAQDIPRQISEFRSVTLPSWVEWVEGFNARYHFNLNVRAFLDQMVQNILDFSRHQVAALPANMQNLVKLLLSTLSTLLVIFIVTAFMLMDLPRVKAGLLHMLPAQLRPGALELAQAIDRDLSGTIRGQLVICLINGTLTTLGLLLLQVKFAITIGFIAGVFSLIPVFGAVISTIPAVLIALTQSIWTALAVVGVIIIIHLIEANFLNPKILGHTVELHPAIIVFSIVVGEHFFGAVGLLFGVPVAAIIRSLVRYFYLKFFADPPDLPLEEADMEAGLREAAIEQQEAMLEHHEVHPPQARPLKGEQPS
ncbi:MAG: AI-2E family transporter [Candidatus Sericytochromatia bacterium]